MAVPGPWDGLGTPQVCKALASPCCWCWWGRDETGCHGNLEGCCQLAILSGSEWHDLWPCQGGSGRPQEELFLATSGGKTGRGGIQWCGWRQIINPVCTECVYGSIKKKKKKSVIFNNEVDQVLPIVVLVAEKDLLSYSRYYGCWWPGDARSQDISGQGIDLLWIDWLFQP